MSSKIPPDATSARRCFECKGGDTSACLTAAQIETAQALYGPRKEDPPDRTRLTCLSQPGSELAWATLAGPEPLSIAVDAFKYVLYKDPQWDWHHFNPATDLDAALGIGISGFSKLQ